MTIVGSIFHSFSEKYEQWRCELLTPQNRGSPSPCFCHFVTMSLEKAIWLKFNFLYTLNNVLLIILHIVSDKLKYIFFLYVVKINFQYTLIGGQKGHANFWFDFSLYHVAFMCPNTFGHLWTHWDTLKKGEAKRYPIKN